MKKITSLKFRKIIILLLFVCKTNLPFAQLNSVIPASPRSKEFEKFINYNVSLYNGLAETNIHFYTIELDGVKIPISLSYHASGIKYGQTSGDVGLGWGLTPSHRITRTVNGRLDEAYNMPDMNNVASGETIGYYLNNAFSSPFDRDLYLARYAVLKPGGEIPVVQASQNDYLDGQFDVFTIGLPDQSGHFIVTDRQNRQITMLDNDALKKVSYTVNGNGINQFDIIDNNGVQYKLGEGDPNNEHLQVFINGALRKYNTAWMLNEITTLFNNKINFQYQSFVESSSGMPVYSRVIVEGDNNQYCSPTCQPTSDNLGVFSQASETEYNSKILTGISTPNETVTFNRNSNGTVNTILIKKANGELIRKISLVYSQPGDCIFLDEVQIAGNDSITIEKFRFDYTSRNINFHTYNYDVFGYCIDQFPGLNYYQYANRYGNFPVQIVGINPFSNLPPSAPESGNDPYCNGLNFPDTTLILDGINKRMFPASEVGMLKKITYPTGGTQVFFYNSNQYAIYDYPYTVYGAGLRISSIIYSDSVKGTALTRNYQYGTGIRTFDPTSPGLSLKEKVVLASFLCGGATLPRIVSLRKTTHSSVLDEELTEALNQSNNGWYNEVTEDYGEGKIIYKFNIPHYNFDLAPYPTNLDYTYQGLSGGNNNVSVRFRSHYLAEYNYWNKPYLQEKLIYEGKFGIYTLKQKENYQYDLAGPFSPHNEFVGLKISNFALGDKIGPRTSAPLEDLYTESGIGSVFNYATYRVTKGGNTLLRKKIVTDYDTIAGELLTTSEYSYTSSNLIKSEKITNSKGEVLITNNKYPVNYAGITGTDDISAGIKKMQDINLINPVIERSTYRSNSDGTNKRLLSSSFYSYKSNLPVPDKIFKTEIATPDTNFTESVVQGGVIVKDNTYKEKISFDVYDSKGNLAQQRKVDDIKHSYVWGYNARYPIAQAQNAAVSDIFHTSFEDSVGNSTEGDSKTGKKSKTGGYLKSLTNLNNGSYILAYWQKSGSNWILQTSAVTVTDNTYDITISGQVDEVRFYPKTAQMTTYTYEPLIGMTSQTDAGNRTTYYEYDPFGRLYLIKDHDRNVINRIDYRYKNTNQL